MRSHDHVISNSHSFQALAVRHKRSGADQQHSPSHVNGRGNDPGHGAADARKSENEGDTLKIFAPLSGVLVPLSAVPDPVFAQKLVGDGISLDPTSGEVLAPVAGEVTQLHSARHALTIRTDAGLEVLVHVGVDTVTLRGDGFRPLVERGDRVALHQPVLTFDVDGVGRKARSLLTQIVIANSERVHRMRPAHGVVHAGRDVVLEVEMRAANAANAITAGEAVYSDPIVLPNPAGLHARPSAVLAARARQFQSDVRIVRGTREANAKSIIGLMQLATRRGDALEVKALGPDAAQAVAALAALLAEGCGENIRKAPAPATPASDPPRRAPANEGDLGGESASPGLAVGTVFFFQRKHVAVNPVGGDLATELARFEAARETAMQELDALSASRASSMEAKIISAHRELLHDPDLIAGAMEGISAGRSAGFAWQEAFLMQAAKLNRLENPLLRERATDICDVGHRVLRALEGVEAGPIEVPPNSILVAEELTPSDVVSFDRTRVIGFCTVTGGVTSHVALLARSMGIPAVCGIDRAALAPIADREVILDGSAGVLRTLPTAAELAEARSSLAREAVRRAVELQQAAAPAITSDGHRVEVAANVRHAGDIRAAVVSGADGVGLLRSEFLFEHSAVAPTEAEQAAAYLEAAEALGPERPLVIRTLDVGGDKPLPYLPLPREDNPFLGVRGIRVGLEVPDLLRTQIRAMLRTAPHCHLHIMFPMVSTLEDFRAARKIVDEEMSASGSSAKVGVMIEVPSAALLAQALAREADFFSIGTNDLTQYTLAMDRGNAKLARQADALHPAVLQLIQQTVAGARRHERWVGVCGGLASEPLAVPLLVGLGVDELSVPAPAIPEIKARIRDLSREACRKLADEVLQMSTASEVRAHVLKYFPAR